MVDGEVFDRFMGYIYSELAWPTFVSTSLNELNVPGSRGHRKHRDGGCKFTVEKARLSYIYEGTTCDVISKYFQLGDVRKWLDNPVTMSTASISCLFEYKFGEPGSLSEIKRLGETETSAPKLLKGF